MFFGPAPTSSGSVGERAHGRTSGHGGGGGFGGRVGGDDAGGFGVLTMRALWSVL